MSSILLKKDRKIICHARPDPPAELPLEWNVSPILPKKKLSLSGLPQFSLFPAPKNARDRDEWGKFLNFLRMNDMVATSVVERYKFYILPPFEVSTSSPVRVAYQMGNSRDYESGSHLAEEHGRSDTLKARGPASDSDLCFPSPGLKISQSEDCACHSTAEQCSGSQNIVNQERLLGNNYVRVDPSYLKTLGQAHSGWIFGGIAELVDNSRDANATKMDIFVDMMKLKKSGKDEPMLSVIDDGQGMEYRDILKMVSFGHKQSNSDDPDRIGRFGVGFKTGAMRLGNDALVLTQTANSRCVAFLSQSLNEGKENVEIPVVCYRRQGQCMQVDTSVHSEAAAKCNLRTIKEFSPFDKYLIGEKAASFSGGTGTQIYIWNLDKWGSNYCLQWYDGLKGSSSFHHGDIFIQSRRIRTRPGQVSVKVPLDYSLRSYLEVIFLVPRMKISVQHSLVRSRPLGNFLTKTIVETNCVLGKHDHLILGFSQLEWEQANCGIFLCWHGRLIEAYKRVGGMIHNADVGRGVIGVIDVTDLMNDGDGRVWVHNNKQGFQDCESYALLELWLGRKVDEYLDNNFDSLKLANENCFYKPDYEWVQCDKCRKWRILPLDFDTTLLPAQWFCYMEPFKGLCAAAEQKMEHGIVNVSTKRSGYDTLREDSHCNDKVDDAMNLSEATADERWVDSGDLKPRAFKRLRRGPSNNAKVESTHPNRFTKARR